MSRSVLLSLAKNIHYEINRDSLILTRESKRLVFHPLGKPLHRALLKLTSGQYPEEELRDAMDDVSQDPALYYCISKLRAAGFLNVTIANRRKMLATFGPSPREEVRVADRTIRYALSRFVYLQFTENGPTLRTPRSRSGVVLHDALAVQALLNMARPFRIQQLHRKVPQIDVETMQIFVDHLWSEKFLELAGEENPELMLWDFHDLLFHTQSREGRNLKPVGGTFRFAGKIEPLPPLKSKLNSETIALKPAPRNEDSLFRVLEKRKSIRVYDDSRPITIRQLGHFLHRVGRVTSVIQPRRSLESYAVATRPYPGGGACYELEIYLTVRICKGLKAGFYYYDPKDHLLCRISEASTDSQQLLMDAQKASRHSVPQVLITIAARFGRVFWKYQSMGYATILKDVGVLFQTMYLVATQMGLAPCALGGGDSDLFARVAGTNYYEETSVGEFMLGSKKRR